MSPAASTLESFFGVNMSISTFRLATARGERMRHADDDDGDEGTEDDRAVGDDYEGDAAGDGDDIDETDGDDDDGACADDDDGDDDYDDADDCDDHGGA
eukprot:2396143-Pyramimonas_sp.AAC.1